MAGKPNFKWDNKKKIYEAPCRCRMIIIPDATRTGMGRKPLFTCKRHREAVKV